VYVTPGDAASAAGEVGKKDDIIGIANSNHVSITSRAEY
jgi:hypothetical protein